MIINMLGRRLNQVYMAHKILAKNVDRWEARLLKKLPRFTLTCEAGNILGNIPAIVPKTHTER